LRKGLEQSWDLLRGDANTRILTCQLIQSMPLDVPARPQAQRSVSGKFARVTEKVEQNLLEIHPIGPHGAQVRTQRAAIRLLFFLATRLYCAQGSSTSREFHSLHDKVVLPAHSGKIEH